MADSLPLNRLNTAHLLHPLMSTLAIPLMHRFAVHIRIAPMLGARMPSHSGRSRVQRRRHTHRVSVCRDPMRRMIRIRPRRLLEELLRRRAQGAASDPVLYVYRRRCLAVNLLWGLTLLELELLSRPLLHHQYFFRRPGREG